MRFGVEELGVVNLLTEFIQPRMPQGTGNVAQQRALREVVSHTTNLGLAQKGTAADSEASSRLALIPGPQNAPTSVAAAPIRSANRNPDRNAA
jgi:hypothetical protein